MRKKVQFIEKRKIGVKQYRIGQKAVIQGGLADVLEAQGVLVVLETIKVEEDIKQKAEEAKAEKPEKPAKAKD